MGWAWVFQPLGCRSARKQKSLVSKASMRGVGGSSGSSFDTQCICAATALQQNIRGCIVMTCSVKEALTSQNA
ncbi:hypothetical protein AARAC_001632 [Aspergillus arachidicola]|uniref:CFEM domain-containing protein n=1 Tax=Aspergillus arachidicola TaxID=656916 RepID=A0A2G7FJN8_9EURO|nr:hypothetical protein AARAC_001632 [Aspergillus arachidicola]